MGCKPIKRDPSATAATQTMIDPTQIFQTLGGFGASPLLSAPPAVIRAGKDEATIIATLSPAGRTFAFAHGRAALLQKLCAECVAPAGRAHAVRADWHFADPARDTELNPSEIDLQGRRPTLPDVIGRDKQGTQKVLYLYVPASLTWFDGHFPGDPILPAIVQIDWVIHFGANADVKGGLDRRRFAAMNRLKFRAVIAPDTVLRLTLDAADDTLEFCYESHDRLHSKGKISFDRGNGGDQG